MSNRSYRRLGPQLGFALVLLLIFGWLFLIAGRPVPNHRERQHMQEVCDGQPQGLPCVR